MTAVKRFLAFDYFWGIWRLRFFLLCLVKNDLDNRYRRSFFGFGWSLIKPLAMTAIFCAVFAKLFGRDPASYAPFLLLGLTLWQFIAESALQGCNCFRVGASYIRQQKIPLAIFPLRTVLANGLHQVIAVVMAIALAYYFQGVKNPVVLAALIPALVLFFLLGVFLATVCGVLHTHFPDTQYLLEISLQILFYLTPIIYPLELLREKGRGLMELVLSWNPITSMLDLVRQPVLEGHWPNPEAFHISVFFVAAMGCLAVLFLKKFERNLVFWI